MKVRVTGWALLGVAIAVVAIVVTAGALRAHGTDAFNRWTGWATIAALPILASSVILLLWDKITGESSAEAIDATRAADVLARLALSRSADQRSRLLSAGGLGDEAANVRFTRINGRLRESGGARDGDLSSVLDYYLSLSPQRMVVLGGSGAGKTVLALELTVRLLECRDRQGDQPVPVLISAAAFDVGLGWDDWLARQLAVQFDISRQAAARLVREGLILPVVDGLDEMDPRTDPRRAQTLVRALNATIRGRQRAPLVVTCRTADYQSLTDNVDRATHVELLPLTSGEAADYLADQFGDRGEQQRWAPVVALMRSNPPGPAASQLATAWRLTMALAAFRDHGDPMTLDPIVPAGARRTEFSESTDHRLLDAYVEAAISLYQPAGRYTSDQVRRWLAALANGLACQARNGGSASDIDLAEWWRRSGETAAAVVHFFLAILPIAWIALVASSGGDWPDGLIFAAMVLWVGLAAGRSPEARRLNIRHIATPKPPRQLMLVFGLAAGTVLALVSATFQFAVPLLAVGLIGALVSWLNDSSAHLVGPRDVIRADGRFGLAFGLMIGLTGFWFVFWFVFVLGYAVIGAVAGGLASGLVVSLVAMLAFFGRSWTRYHVAVVIMAIRRQGPLKFGKFLDWARSAGLLRVCGTSYQFRHRELQDRFTTQLAWSSQVDHRSDR